MSFGLFPHLHKICRVLDAEGISRGSGKTFSPSIRHFLDQGCCCMGVSPTLLPHTFISCMILVLMSLLYTVDVSYLDRQSPPQSVNQTGDFHSADGTDPQGGGSLLCWTYISPSLSLLAFSFAAFHSWEGPFRLVTFGLLPQAPPLLVISFGAFQGGLSVHDNHMLGR
jgi:hypothetical protein